MASVRDIVRTSIVPQRVLGEAARRLLPLHRIFRDDRGSATVEHALWLPVFASLIGVSIDASLSFHTHGRMWDAARETARRVAVGEMTGEQARSYAARLLPGNASYAIDVVETSDAMPTVTVSIVASSADVSIFGTLDLLTIERLSTVYSMRREVLPEEDEEETSS
ncbi:MAG: TadE/TadG family type IV pilus assembly protein [Pseudomonadota bacterium]